MGFGDLVQASRRIWRAFCYLRSLRMNPVGLGLGVLGQGLLELGLPGFGEDGCDIVRCAVLSGQSQRVLETFNYDWSKPTTVQVSSPPEVLLLRTVFSCSYLKPACIPAAA